MQLSTELENMYLVTLHHDSAYRDTTTERGDDVSICRKCRREKERDAIFLSIIALSDPPYLSFF